MRRTVCDMLTRPTGVDILARVRYGMFKKAGQRGRSEQRGEAYSVSYGEPLRDARTTRTDFFNILLVGA